MSKALSEIMLPNIPNTMNFWHGGNLDNYEENKVQKSGRYEFGAGLYITTHYSTAIKYSKGSRKLYLITVEKGNDINDSFINIQLLNSFIKKNVIASKREDVMKRVEARSTPDGVKAFIFNTIILNEKAIKSSNTDILRAFYVEQGIDYEIVDNPFGWGEKMMVLYNMKKIKQTLIVKPNDKILIYDLPQEFTPET